VCVCVCVCMAQYTPFFCLRKSYVQEPLSRWIQSVLGGEGVHAPSAASPVSNALRQDGNDCVETEADEAEDADLGELEEQKAAASQDRSVDLQDGQDSQEGQEGATKEEDADGLPKLELVQKVLNEQEGVLAAFPGRHRGRQRDGVSEDGRAEGAVFRLQGAKYGSSLWWIARLGSSPFGMSDTYYRKNGGLVVHRLGGAPDERNWNWAPPGAAYGFRVGDIGKFMDSGLSLEIEAFGKRGSVVEMMHMVQLRLHAARVRIAPAVFASMLARFPDKDKANARREWSRDRNQTEATPALVGVLTASQLHTYTFHDLLRAVSDPEKTADDLECTRSALVAAGTEVALLLKRVATKSGLIILNAVSEYVVFVPRLEPSEDGEHWVVHGLSLKTSVHDFIEGEAMLIGVDERLWLPVDEVDASANATNANSNANSNAAETASWAFHSGLFLASVAQRHRGAAEAVAEGFLDALGWERAVCNVDVVAQCGAESIRKKLDGALAKRPLGQDAVGDVLLSALGEAAATFLDGLKNSANPTPSQPSQVLALASKCFGPWTRHVAQGGPWN